MESAIKMGNDNAFEVKQRGKRKRSRNNIGPEITKKLGDANLHYVHGHYEAAISVLKEVAQLAPDLSDLYQMLGLVFSKMGDIKKATDFNMLAAYYSPKDTSLWKRLVTKFQGDTGQALSCLSRAIIADPSDITLRYCRASLFMEAGDYIKAAETYDQIVRMSQDYIEALEKATSNRQRSLPVPFVVYFKMSDAGYIEAFLFADLPIPLLGPSIKAARCT